MKNRKKKKKNWFITGTYTSAFESEISHQFTQSYVAIRSLPKENALVFFNFLEMGRIVHS